MQIITWPRGLVTSVADTEKDVRTKLSAYLYQLVNQYDFYKQSQVLLRHYIGFVQVKGKTNIWKNLCSDESKHIIWEFPSF